MGGIILGLYGRRPLGEDICLACSEGHSFSSLTLAYNPRSKEKVSAKIDRPGGVVDFKTQAQGADWLLNQWVGKIDKLLNTLDKANHLIHKEAMAHKVSLEA